ncbi:Uncharacterised protein [Mycobacteroides abscessus subsp. abscessus]|nr:Uncharacterised protein [Mycobacteroides abscessus subsp. abscessus]
MHVGSEGGNGVVVESSAVRVVVGDRPTVGLVTANREFDGAHAEGLGDGVQRGVVDSVNPRGATIGHRATRSVAVHASADPVTRFENSDPPTGAGE